MAPEELSLADPCGWSFLLPGGAGAQGAELAPGSTGFCCLSELLSQPMVCAGQPLAVHCMLVLGTCARLPFSRKGNNKCENFPEADKGKNPPLADSS